METCALVTFVQKQRKLLMSISQIKGKNVPINLWAPVHEIESGAIDQLKNIAALPWVVHVAAMPDIHVGKGCCVGSVIGMKDAVSPSAVGVDIGCGMFCAKTSLDPDKVDRKLKQIYSRIEETIPTGFGAHEDTVSANRTVVGDMIYSECKALFEEFKNLDKNVHGLIGKAGLQLGTLGGGNHFIELCHDTDMNVWIMLHSGSRNIGKELAEIHIAKAKELTHNKELPDRDLAVFLGGTPEMAAYRHDLLWAQNFAALNRKVMIKLLKNVIAEFWPGATYSDEVNCHHNYVAEEVHFGEQLMVTRKGAIKAGTGDMGIIPGSMGTRSYVVRGLGNPLALNSASHGAGRKMSRGKAKSHFTREDLIEQTEGVMCRKDTGVIDEIPKAYKSIEKVMANQSDLVEVVAELKQFLCIKG